MMSVRSLSLQRLQLVSRLLSVTSLNRALPCKVSTAVPSPDTLLINEKAIKQLGRVCTAGERLRIGVEGGGCSGFQYLFSLDSPQTPCSDDDILIQYKGFTVVIDEDSLEFVKGSTLDYDMELIRSAFRLVDNPLAETGCSCGSSFSVKD